MEDQLGGTRTVRPRLRAWLLLSPAMVLGLLVGSCGAGLAIAPEEYPGNHEAGVIGLAIGAIFLATVLPPLLNPLIQVRNGVLIKRNVLRVQRRWPVSQLRWIQLDASHLDAVLPDGTRAFRLSLHWWRKAKVERLGDSLTALEGGDFPITPAMAKGVTLAADHAPSQGVTVRALPIAPQESRVLRKSMVEPRIAIALAGLGVVSVAVTAIAQAPWRLMGGIALVALPLAAIAAWRWRKWERELSAGLMIKATGGLELGIDYSDEGNEIVGCSVIVSGIKIDIPVRDRLGQGPSGALDVVAAIEQHATPTKSGFSRFNGTVEYLPSSRVALRVWAQKSGTQATLSDPGGLVFEHPAFAMTLAMAREVTLRADHKPSQSMTVRALPITPEDVRALRQYTGGPRIAIALAGLGAVSVAVAAIVQDWTWQLGTGAIAFAALFLAALAALQWRTLEREISAGLMLTATGTLEFRDYNTRRGADGSLLVNGIGLDIPESAADAFERHATLTKERVLEERDLGERVSRRYWRFNGTVEYLPRSRVALRVCAEPGGLVYQHPALVPQM